MLQDAVRDFCAQHGFEKTYWVAYSGGLDSHVLLVLLNILRQHTSLKLRAIHINHGLSPNASAWAQHCEQVCRTLEVDYVEKTIRLECKAGESLEEVAREQRYRWIADCLEEGDVLLTAHQQDDQAETVLLQLLRGSGLKGLAAMPTMKTFARGFHGRPLLSFSRSDLQIYAKTHSLSWIEDESNSNLRLTRNFLRHECMPLLKSRWPTVAATLSRSATHCAEAQQLLNEYALEDCLQCRGTQEETLSVQQLVQLQPPRQRQVLRTWIRARGYDVPDSKKMASILGDVLTAGWDRSPCVSWGEVELRRYRDDLYLMSALQSYDAERVWTWDFTSPLMLQGVGLLQAVCEKGRGLRMDIQHVRVRFRQGGEWLDLAKRGRHTLKNLLQEWQVLPWERDRIPLIYVGDRLVGVVGYYLEEAYMATYDEMGWDIKW